MVSIFTGKMSLETKPSTALSSMTMTPTAVPDDDPTPPLTFPREARAGCGEPSAGLTSIKAESMHTYVKHGQTQVAAATAGLAGE